MYEIVFDAASERHYGGAYVHIHRGDLHTVLEHAVAPGTIAFDHQLVDLEEKTNAVRLIFANGASAEADIVIGADGIRSKVRDYLLGAEPPRFAKAAAYRAIFPADRLNGEKIPDCTKWWGKDRHCLPYYLTGRRDEVYAIGVVPTARWDGDEASVPSRREWYHRLGHPVVEESTESLLSEGGFRSEHFSEARLRGLVGDSVIRPLAGIAYLVTF